MDRYNVNINTLMHAELKTAGKQVSGHKKGTSLKKVAFIVMLVTVLFTNTLVGSYAEKQSNSAKSGVVEKYAHTFKNFISQLGNVNNALDNPSYTELVTRLVTKGVDQPVEELFSWIKFSVNLVREAEDITESIEDLGAYVKWGWDKDEDWFKNYDNDIIARLKKNVTFVETVGHDINKITNKEIYDYVLRNDVETQNEFIRRLTTMIVPEMDKIYELPATNVIPPMAVYACAKSTEISKVTPVNKVMKVVVGQVVKLPDIKITIKKPRLLFSKKVNITIPGEELLWEIEDKRLAQVSMGKIFGFKEGKTKAYSYIDGKKIEVQIIVK